MTGKFLSLLHSQDELRLAPGKHHIPAEEFSSLITAEELLEKLREDAKKYRKKNASKCKVIRKKAQEEGFLAGQKEWTAQIEFLQKEIDRVEQKMHKLVLPIALKAAQKIVGQEIQSHPDTLVSIVSNSLRAVAHHKEVRLYVSEKDFPILEKNKEDLKANFEHLEFFSIAPREDVEEGSCIIETEAGIINARLEEQWALLEQAFERLMEKE